MPVSKAQNRKLLQQLHSLFQSGVRVRFDRNNTALHASKTHVYYRLYRNSGKPSCVMIGLPIIDSGVRFDA